MVKRRTKHCLIYFISIFSQRFFILFQLKISDLYICKNNKKNGSFLGCLIGLYLILKPIYFLNSMNQLHLFKVIDVNKIVINLVTHQASTLILKLCHMKDDWQGHLFNRPGVAGRGRGIIGK